MSKTARSAGRSTRSKQKSHILKIAQKRAKVRVVSPQPMDLADISSADLKSLDATSKVLEFLGGEPVESKTVQVPVDKLVVKTDNPRTICLCADDKPATEAEIKNLLLNHDVANLILQLAHNGGLPEPIVGVAEKKGKVSVLDGNRRAVASKVLLGQIPIPNEWPKGIREEIEEAKKNGFPPKVPVKVFTKITRFQQQAFLAIKHCSGDRKWPSIAKGGFAYNILCERSKMKLTCNKIADLRTIWSELKKTSQEQLKAIALICGTQVSCLRNYIMAYVANSLYCGMFKVDDQRERFTYFAKFYGWKWARDMAEGKQPTMRDNGETVDILAPDPEIEAKFMDWIARKIITDCCQVDILDTILGDERLVKEMEENGMAKAWDLYKRVREPAVIYDDAIACIENLTPTAIKAKDAKDMRTSLKLLKETIRAFEKKLGKPL